MNPEEIGNFLDQYTIDYFLEQALNTMPTDVDTREGSIIYDALAPSATQMALFALDLKSVLRNSFVQTATGEYLDLKAEEHGISRLQATNAILTASFTTTNGEPYTTIEEGNQFSSIGDMPIIYSVVKQVSDGVYTLQAQTSGTIGNQYIGELLPIDHFNDLKEGHITEVTISARDVESDEALRQRILTTYQVNTFGGNIEDYIQFTSRLVGVGAVRVFPISDTSSTINIFILGSDLNLPSQSIINSVQQTIYPANGNGYGIAPIGHKVIVASPTQQNVDVSLHVDTSVAIDTIRPQIQNALANFFVTLRGEWGVHNELYQYNQTVFRAQIISSLLQVQGVTNVRDVLLNNADSDLTIENSSAAFLGTVVYT